jgi:hypothetical protein
MDLLDMSTQEVSALGLLSLEARRWVRAMTGLQKAGSSSSEEGPCCNLFNALLPGSNNNNSYYFDREASSLSPLPLAPLDRDSIHDLIDAAAAEAQRSRRQHLKEKEEEERLPSPVPVPVPVPPVLAKKKTKPPLIMPSDGVSLVDAVLLNALHFQDLMIGGRWEEPTLMALFQEIEALESSSGAWSDGVFSDSERVIVATFADLLDALDETPPRFEETVSKALSRWFLFMNSKEICET